MTNGEASASPHAEQLVLGVTWNGGVPSLDTAAVGSGTRLQVPLLGQPVCWRVTRPGRFCTGCYGFVRGVGQRLACPDSALAASSGSSTTGTWVVT